MSKGRLVIVSLLIVAAAVAVSSIHYCVEKAEAEWYRHALWLNYDAHRVDESTLIDFERPDLGDEIVLTIDISQLPPSCLDSSEWNAWVGGAHGRLALDQNKTECRVEPNLRWSQEESISHLRELKTYKELKGQKF